MAPYLTRLDQLSNLIDHIAEEATKITIRTFAPAPGVEEAYLPCIDEFVLYITIRSYTTVPELLMCLVYLSRFHRCMPLAGVTERPFTTHRVFLAAMMLAHKVHNDDSVNNTCWAECSAIPECGFPGFSNVELNLIEMHFLACLDWDVHISASLYDLLAQQMELDWACGCTMYIDVWKNSAHQLSHCFTCLIPSYAQVQMQKKVHARERSRLLQHPHGDQSLMAPHHQAAFPGHNTLETEKTNAT